MDFRRFRVPGLVDKAGGLEAWIAGSREQRDSGSLMVMCSGTPGHAPAFELTALLVWPSGWCGAEPRTPTTTT